MAPQNRQWILKRRPQGEVHGGDLVLEIVPLPDPVSGEVVIRNEWLSLDPTNRIWMSEMDQYMPPVPLGAPMRGVAAGRVVASACAAFSAGDRVMGIGSWGDYSCGPAANWSPVPDLPGIEYKDVFGQLVVVGPTAYFGLTAIGVPKIGETLVVSGAAGAVGSIVGQLGKALGCKVVGIAGGPEKCAWITGELGFDHAIDYKHEPIDGRLDALCPEGVDVYFDNVGGPTLDHVLARMNLFGRVIECGMISIYNHDGRDGAPSHYPRILMKRLKVQGFIVSDFQARYPEAIRALAQLRREGRLKWRSHVVEGLENAFQAVRLLYSGGNRGKLMVRISDA